jgi:small-conductance mechanosensitive channel
MGVMISSVRSMAQVEDAEELRDSATNAWDTLIEALPRMGIAVVVVVVLVLLGRGLRPVVRRRLQRRRTPSFARVFANLTSSAATLVGVLLAVTIVFPSVRPVDVLTGAGVITIAAGFAFQDILQNLLAGLLLLFREPFRGGDQVQVGDVVGTVEEINIRETVVTTFDGRRVLIPNATVYTDVICVQTAHETVRASFVVGVAYESDLGDARRVALAALGEVDGVASTPPPEVLVHELAESTVDLEVMFWCNARQLELRRVRSTAIDVVKNALDAHHIEMPSQVVALQATSSFQASLQGRAVTPGGAVEASATPAASERAGG